MQILQVELSNKDFMQIRMLCCDHDKTESRIIADLIQDYKLSRWLESRRTLGRPAYSDFFPDDY